MSIVLLCLAHLRRIHLEQTVEIAGVEILPYFADLAVPTAEEESIEIMVVTAVVEPPHLPELGGSYLTLGNEMLDFSALAAHHEQIAARTGDQGRLVELPPMRLTIKYPQTSQPKVPSTEFRSRDPHARG